MKAEIKGFPLCNCCQTCKIRPVNVMEVTVTTHGAGVLTDRLQVPSTL